MHIYKELYLSFIYTILNLLYFYFNSRKKEEADSIAKANRQRKREEKRKRKVLTTYRKQEEDKVSMKIAREEKKLIKAQRQLESIRLLDELFDRIKVSKRRICNNCLKEKIKLINEFCKHR